MCSTMKHSSLEIQRLAVCVRDPHTEERSGSSNIYSYEYRETEDENEPSDTEEEEQKKAAREERD